MVLGGNANICFEIGNFGQNYATPLTIPGKKLDCYLVGFYATRIKQKKINSDIKILRPR